MKKPAIISPLAMGILVIISMMSCDSSLQKDETFATSDLDPHISDTIRIAGSWGLYPLVSEWAEQFQIKYPNVHFEVIKANTEQAKKMVSDGLIDMVMLSQELQIRKECFRVAVAKGGIVPIYNIQNPYIDQIRAQGLTHLALVQAYESGSANWGEWFGIDSKNPVNLYTRADTSGAAITWAQFLWMDQSEVKGIPTYGEEEMLEKVLNDPLGFGYANMNNVFDLETRGLLPGLAILPLDLNYNGRIDNKESMPGDLDGFRRSVCLGKYPKNLCRNLYFAAPQEPTAPAISAFIAFCLSEGQTLVDSMGYGSIRPR